MGKHLEFEKKKTSTVSWENNSEKRTAGQGVWLDSLWAIFFPLTFPRRYFIVRKVYTAPLRRGRHLLPAIRKHPNTYPKSLSTQREQWGTAGWNGWGGGVSFPFFLAFILRSRALHALRYRYVAHIRYSFGDKSGGKRRMYLRRPLSIIYRFVLLRLYLY